MSVNASELGVSNYKDFSIHSFQELESTNSYAFIKAQAREMFEGEIVVANVQSLGRGRMDRKWESPKGNLYFSLVLNPKVSLAKVSELSFLASVALRAAIENISNGIKIENKWPNDILINGKKIAGILLESEIQNDEVSFVILGVGVNIESKPENLIFPAISLRDVGIEIFPEEFLKKFLDEFELLYRNWLDFGFVGIRRLWLEKAYNLGKKITVKLDEESIEGIFEDVDAAGNLLLRVADEVRQISVGDVS